VSVYSGSRTAFFLSRYLLLRLIEKRLEVALDEHLAKAIARKLYDELYLMQ